MSIHIVSSRPAGLFNGRQSNKTSAPKQSPTGQPQGDVFFSGRHKTKGQTQETGMQENTRIALFQSIFKAEPSILFDLILPNTEDNRVSFATYLRNFDQLDVPLNVQNRQGVPLLSYALQARNSFAFNALLKQKSVNVNQPDRLGRTPLMYAAVQGNIPATRALLQNGANIELTNRFGKTATDIASLRGQTELLEILLEHQQLPLKQGKELRHTAAYMEGRIKQAFSYENKTTILRNQCQLKLVRDAHFRSMAFIVAGADINDVDPQTGDTPAMLAASKGRKEVLIGLIESDADINRLNLAGESALTLAASRGDEAIVQALIDGGANVRQQGHKAIENAEEAGHTDIVNLLKAHPDYRVE